LVHGKPVSSYLTVQIPVTNSGAFQLHSEPFGASVSHVVFDRLLDEPAALTRLGHSVDGPDRRFRQDDVNAFVHGDQNLNASAFYTP
jgi:hypothetical protein